MLFCTLVVVFVALCCRPPGLYPLEKRYEMANSSVWGVDQVPKRIQDIRTMLNTKFALPTVIYVHCSAGCDRTGEVIGSYRIQFQTQNLTEVCTGPSLCFAMVLSHVACTCLPQMYALDTSECGRSPNYFSTAALEWYCYYYEDQHNREDIGNCDGFATCTPFGKCQPSGNNASVAELAPESPIVRFDAGM